MNPNGSDPDVQALKTAYLDEHIDRHVREHAFYGYWVRTLHDMTCLSRQTISELLQFKQWISPLGDILYRACLKNAITQADALWLLSELPVGTFAHDQLSAFAVLGDATVDWKDKLTSVLNWRADWAARRLLMSFSVDQIGEAKIIIAQSRRPKASRSELLDAASQRLQSLSTPQKGES